MGNDIVLSFELTKKIPITSQLEKNEVDIMIPEFFDISSDTKTTDEQRRRHPFPFFLVDITNQVQKRQQQQQQQQQH